ncbi:MAG: DUF447 family protein [Methanomicrobiales archaeon]|jgi:hypothetical protein|nr:DUF447 family protein [Methanomicrobiales archaeon]
MGIKENKANGVECAFDILREGINEVIVATEQNAAPMGVIRKKDSLHMAVYLTAHTAQILQRCPFAVLHITDDPRWFVRTAFFDPDPEEYVLEKCTDFFIPRLREIPSWIACTCRVQNKTKEKLLVSLTPIRVVQSPHVFHPVNRGYNSVIEATVHATRYVDTKDPKLGDLISFHLGVAQKCGDEAVKEAVKMLLQHLSEQGCTIVISYR